MHCIKCGKGEGKDTLCSECSEKLYEKAQGRKRPKPIDRRFLKLCLATIPFIIIGILVFWAVDAYPQGKIILGLPRIEIEEEDIKGKGRLLLRTYQEKDLYQWTKETIEQQRDIKIDLPRPEVKFVSKEELMETFLAESPKFLARIKKETPEKVEQIIAYYRSEIVALIIPRTNQIFIGEFLEGIERNAKIVHEYTHYFQYNVKGVVPDINSKDIRRAWEELHAQKMETLYREEIE